MQVPHRGLRGTFGCPEGRSGRWQTQKVPVRAGRPCTGTWRARRWAPRTGRARRQGRCAPPRRSQTAGRPSTGCRGSGRAIGASWRAPAPWRRCAGGRPCARRPRVPVPSTGGLGGTARPRPTTVEPPALPPPDAPRQSRCRAPCPLSPTTHGRPGSPCCRADAHAEPLGASSTAALPPPSQCTESARG